MKPMSLGLMTAFLSCSASSLAWADYKSSIPAAIQLHVSPQGGWSGSTSTVPPTANFSGFSQSDSGRWFTITSGPEFINLLGGRSASFIGQLVPDKCTVANSPLPIVQNDWDFKQSLYQKQTRQLQACVQVRVHDPSGVTPAPDQQECQIERVDEREVVASGGVCFFQISPLSNFELKYEIKPQCADSSQFAAVGLEPLDIFAFAGFYVSGDATGRSPTLKPLGSTALRMTIEASDSVVRMSTNMGQGTPRWPVVAHPDVHMGEFEIYQRDDASPAVLTTRLFARNACMEQDKTECNFGFPMGMQFNLGEVRADGKIQLIDQWYTGGVVPPFWQGFMPANRELANAAFRKGQRYRLEADLTWMSMYYKLFRDGFTNFLVSLGLWKIDPNQPLVPLRPVATIPGLKGILPQQPLPNFSPLVPGGANDMSVELNRLRGLVVDLSWPPLYEQLCSEDACVRALDGQARLKVGIDFTFDGIVNGKAQTSALRVWRESSYLSDYVQSTDAMMRPQCE